MVFLKVTVNKKSCSNLRKKKGFNDTSSSYDGLKEYLGKKEAMMTQS